RTGAKAGRCHAFAASEIVGREDMAHAWSSGCAPCRHPDVRNHRSAGALGRAFPGTSGWAGARVAPLGGAVVGRELKFDALPCTLLVSRLPQGQLVGETCSSLGHPRVDRAGRDLL